eukprot:1140286-Pelagomonas_calceolata.AAC.2
MPRPARQGRAPHHRVRCLQHGRPESMRDCIPGCVDETELVRLAVSCAGCIPVLADGALSPCTTTKGMQCRPK